MKRPNPAADLEMARELRAAGLSYDAIGRKLGCSHVHVSNILNPEARLARSRREMERRSTPTPRTNDVRPPTLSEAELRIRRQEIPDDCRDLTARLMGDPIPADPRRARA